MEHYRSHHVINAPGKRPKRRCFGANCVSAFSCAIARLAREALSGAIALVFLATAGLPAAAQVFVANGGTGGAKALTGYDAPGISSGDFLLKSTFSFGVAYDSNILRAQSSANSDYILFATSAFDLTRDGGNHIEEVFASVTSARYANSEADDFTNATVRASETYLLSQSSQIIVNASFADGYERRVSSNHDIPTDAAAPVHNQALLGNIGYRKAWEDFDAGVNVTASRQTFDDVRSVSGAMLDQTFRDEDDLALATFLNIRLSPRIQSTLTFWAGHSNVRDQTRDSDQWRFSDVTTVNLTSKTSIGFLAAVSEQNYYNNPLAEIRPLGEYEALLRWSPIQRLTFTARAGYHDLGVNFLSGIDSANGINNGGVGRYGSLDCIYLIWRNLQLTSNLHYEKMDFSGSQTVQTSTGGRTALTYEFNTHAGLSFLYTYDRLDSNSTQFMSYDESVFQTSLNFRF